MAKNVLANRLARLKDGKTGKRVHNRPRKRKAPPLKNDSSRKKDDIIVGASNLKWKSVEIPDTLDDFGGFYGLEEIDGVDVKVVNGTVQFVAHDRSKVKLPDQSTDDKEHEESKRLVKFKNLDDVKEGQLSEVSSNDSLQEEQGNDDGSDSDSDSEHDSDKDNKKEDDSEKDIHKEGDSDEGKQYEDELKSNVFNTNLDIEDVGTPDLPEWNSLVPLSFTTLHGLSKLGYFRPTEIQKMAIPVALKGEDIMGKSATGSGKTLAYGIPILENLVKKKDESTPIALIFTPTRELAQQVTNHLQRIADLITKNSPYSIVSLTGGLSIQKQERLLKYEGSARIVVATPGRFLELIEKDEKLVSRFAKIDTLVLDEADRLLQDGHFDEFENILKFLGNARKASKKEGWQTMIFSATFAMDLFDKLGNSSWKKLKKGDEDEMEVVLDHLMQKIHFKSKPVIIQTNSEQRVSAQIKESLIECGPLERDLYSYYFVTMYPGTTLIFCNAIDSVKKLNAYLNNLGITSFQIHSSMTQKNRLRSLERYQQHSQKNNVLGKPTVLIASDVAARGLDIPDIQHVIHYHLPRTADVYIHRSGRTGRAENEGVSVMICSPDEALGPLRKLRKVLATKNGSGGDFKKRKKWQKDVPLLPIDSGIVKQLRERSRLASQLADHDLVSSSLKKDEDWLKKAADDLGMDVDSEDGERDVTLAKNKNKKLNKTISKEGVKSLRAELTQLLRIPLRKDLRKKYLTGGLVNLADNLVKKRGHDTIIGHDKVDALKLLKGKIKKAKN